MSEVEQVFTMSDRQNRICMTIVGAATRTVEELRLKQVFAPSFTVPETLNEVIGQQMKKYFDLHQMIRTEQCRGIRHMFEGTDPEEVIRVYRKYYVSIANDIGIDDVTDDEVSEFRRELSKFLKQAIPRKKPGPRKLYISDLHFYHNRLCKELDKRGFADYTVMNEYMIRRWNEKVTSRDEVYILGDFSITKGEATNKIINQLNGKLYLLRGNHDRFLDDKSFDYDRFRWIRSYEEVHDNGRLVILSHYPVFCYRGQYQRNQQGEPVSYMLYGHVHDTHDERLVHRFIRQTQQTLATSRYAPYPEPIPCNMINCFCMFSDYQPMTLDEWIVVDRERRAAIDAEELNYESQKESRR